MKPLYIFDYDGTLALIDHRKHLISKGKAEWDEFYKACVHDLPNDPVIKIFDVLLESGKNDIEIWSGRSDIIRAESQTWLQFYTSILWASSRRSVELRMRPDGDFTPDEQLKMMWYNALSDEDKKRLVCVFDDRQKVVDMYRSLGVTCLQVAPGNF